MYSVSCLTIEQVTYVGQQEGEGALSIWQQNTVLVSGDNMPIWSPFRLWRRPRLGTSVEQGEIFYLPGFEWTGRYLALHAFSHQKGGSWYWCPGWWTLLTKSENHQRVIKLPTGDLELGIGVFRIRDWRFKSQIPNPKNTNPQFKITNWKFYH